MKKLFLFLLLPILALSQNPTNFPYGIKNTVGAENSTPAFFTTQETDGVHRKTPAALIAKQTDLQLKQTVFTGISQSQFLTENDIVIDNTARTLTIATIKNGETISGSNPVEFFTDGNGVSVKHTKTSPVVFSFTDTTGIWYFYFNSSGTAIASQTAPTDPSTIAMVYRIYWNAALATADKRVIESIEVYKNDGSWIDREWKNTQGAQYASGLNISSNVIASGTPAVDGSNAVINISSGTIIDNNFNYTLTNSASGTTKFTQDLGSGLLPATSGKFITITNNASLVLDKIPATDFPFLWNSGTNTPEYLTQLGVRTAVTNNYFFVYYVYALQDPRRGETIKIKSAEIDFANATLAEAHTWAQLQNLFPTLRDSKIRLLYKLTFEYKSSYDVGTKKSALRKVDDLRKQRITTSATVGGTVPASIVTFSPSGNISSTNVQLAIEELDAEKQAALGFTPENVANKATDFTVVDNTKYPSVQAVKTYADGLVVGLLDDRGSYDASVNTFPTTGGSGTAGAVVKGDLWYVSVAGTLGGQAVAVGDSFRALVDAPGQTLANWSILEGNVAYVPANDALVAHLAGTETFTGTKTLPSPIFTGTPTAPTATAGTNTTQIATTAFVTAADAGNVKLTGNQSIFGEKLFQSSLATPSRVRTITNSDATISALTAHTSSPTQPAFLLTVNATGGTAMEGTVIGGGGNAVFLRSNLTGSGGSSSTMLLFDNILTGNDITPIRVKKQGVEVSKIDYLGNITATSFIKSGGTSSQFLKADGSSDSNSYALSSGSTSYIQNQNASAQSANMWISGTGQFGTTGNNNNKISVLDGTIINKIQSQTVGDTAGALGTETNHDLKLITNNTERLRIASTGAATFSNDVLLNGGTGNRNLDIQTNTSGDPALRLIAAGSDAGAISYNRATSELTFSNSGVTGALKIGASGTSTFAGSIFARADNSIFTVDTGSSSRIGFTKKAGSAPYLTYGNTEPFIIAESSGTGIEASNTFTPRLTIVNGGNVGIGTSSPSHFLTILGSDSTLPSLGSNGGKFGLLNGTGGGQYGLISGILNNGNAYQQVQRVDGTATAYNLLLQPNGGNVGIGTTSPDSKLTIEDNSAIIKTRVVSEPNDYWTTYNTLYQANSFKIINRAAGVTRELLGRYGNNLSIMADGGNVLIGTTTDDVVNKFQVSGGIKSSQYRVSALNTAPASATDTGTTGEIRVTADYIYVCTATNTWVRTALTTW